MSLRTSASARSSRPTSSATRSGRLSRFVPAQAHLSAPRPPRESRCISRARWYAAPSGNIPEHWPSQAASILAAMTGRDEELGLRRVAPIAHRFADGTWLLGVEVWDHGVVVRWANSQPEPRVA